MMLTGGEDVLTCCCWESERAGGSLGALDDGRDEILVSEEVSSSSFGAMEKAKEAKCEMQ